MIRSLLAATVSAAALALSLPAAAQDSAAPAASVLPTINFGTWGFDVAALDPAVKPGDDFFEYVNGKWNRENPIPAEFARFGAFNLLRDQATTNVHALIDDLVKANPAPGTQERRIVDSYQAFMDTAAIDAKGMAPAKPYLDAIASAKTLAELAPLFGKGGMPHLVAAGVTVDQKDPEAYIAGVGFDGMGLPDRDYYLEAGERNEEIQAKYKDYLTFLFTKAGAANPRAEAETVYAFEHEVAKLEWDRTALRNRDLTYHKLTRQELEGLAPQFPLAAVLDAAGLAKEDAFFVSQIPPSAERAAELGLPQTTLDGIGAGFPGMLKLLASTPVSTLKSVMTAHFLNNNAAYLPSDVDAARFAFYGTLLQGQEAQQPRWKRAVDVVEGQLGEQLGALYVARYFPPESKAAMDELVANLRRALGESLAENTWMGEATKVEAMAKLNSFTPKIGYPDTFKTYDGLVIKGDDVLGNAVRALEWQQKDDLARLGKPVDRSEWGMFPQTVNAYYNPVFNEIVFPAGILQLPFFGANADAAINYGGIGAVIGHEMGHGFDDQGAKSDSKGVLRDWWQAEDLARFTELGDRIAAQYDAFCPYDDGKTCVNGRFTLGENIGDVGGLSMAYRAYRMSLNGKEAPVIDGLTGDQRFFIAWAQVWRSAQREAAGRQRLLTDPHSPEEYRTNGAVRNHDAWYKAFNVQPGDKLYLAPQDRVSIF